MIKPIEKQNIGNAGEYYIASYLSARDYTVTITLGRAEKYDLLCVTPDNKRTIKLSVKTRWDSVKSFALSKKDEEGGNEDFYYVFVNLNCFESSPDFWIIPSERLNYILKTSAQTYYEKWITKTGTKPNEMNLRKLDFITTEKTKILYPDNWMTEVNDYYKDKILNDNVNAIS